MGRVFLLCLAISMPLATSAQQVWPTEFSVLGNTLYMRGELTSNTPGRFEDLMAKEPQVETIVQCEMPGSIDLDALYGMAYRVRELGLDTYLTAQSEIASGAVDLFLSGNERRMEVGAEIGIHAWSNGRYQATDFDENHFQHDNARTYVADMLGSESFYWFVIRASDFDGMHWMNAEEIKKYLALTEPPLMREGLYDCDKAFE